MAGASYTHAKCSYKFDTAGADAQLQADCCLLAPNWARVEPLCKMVVKFPAAWLPIINAIASPVLSCQRLKVKGWAGFKVKLGAELVK